VSVFAPDVPSNRQSHPALTVIAVGIVIALLYFGRVLVITVVTAVILAFLLDPAVRLFMKFKLPRAFASFVVCSISLLGLYFVGLGVYSESVAMFDDLPAYSQRIGEIVDGAAAKIDSIERSTYELLVPGRYRETAPPNVTNPPTTLKKGRSRRATAEPPAAQTPPPIQEVRIRPEPKPFVSYVYGYVTAFYDVVLMASFVPFLVYFMLSWRDHLRRSFLYLFNAADRQIAGRSWEGVAEMARAYVIGNFLLGVLIGIASAIFFVMIGLPYALLIGPLSGFLSLVPYVGVPLAMIPPVFAALPVYNQPTMYVVIALVVTLFHLLALNLLYPKMVGSRVHLNPLAVTLALMFWGTLWGGIGLLLGIPITAGVKAVCDNVSNWKPYGKLLGD
jgi:predicted PurR-regulated permease PerM